jgi:hypothetical protein
MRGLGMEVYDYFGFFTSLKFAVMGVNLRAQPVIENIGWREQNLNRLC